jgi:hypothetical protein
MHYSLKIILWLAAVLLMVAVLEYYVFTNLNMHRVRAPSCYTGLEFKYKNVNKEDRERIERGVSVAKGARVVIVGLAKDIKERIELNIRRAEYIGQAFDDYRIIVFENDSSDGTKEFLDRKSKDDRHVEVVECCDLGDCGCKLKKKGAGSLGSEERIDLMTKYRNEALEHVMKFYSEFDYMIVIDLDAEGPCPVEGVLHSLSFTDWDVIASNGKSLLAGTLGMQMMTYDPLAFVEDEFEDTADRSLLGLFYHYGRQQYIVNNSGSGLVKVKSAFNGATLYRMKSVGTARYKNIMGCEHIGLHKNMVEDGHERIFVNKFWAWYVGYQGQRSISTPIN